MCHTRRSLEQPGDLSSLASGLLGSPQSSGLHTAWSVGPGRQSTRRSEWVFALLVDAVRDPFTTSASLDRLRAVRPDHDTAARLQRGTNILSARFSVLPPPSASSPECVLRVPSSLATARLQRAMNIHELVRVPPLYWPGASRSLISHPKPGSAHFSPPTYHPW